MNANTASRTELAVDSGSNMANVSWSTLAFDSDSDARKAKPLKEEIRHEIGRC